MKFDQLIVIVMGYIFEKSLAQFGKLGSKSRLFLIYRN